MANNHQTTPATIDELKLLHLKLLMEPVPTKIWKGLLSKDERGRLGGGQFPPADLLKRYAKVRGCTPMRTIVDVAKSVSLLDEADYQRLRSEIGEPIESPRVVPQWNSETGELIFRGELIRNKVSKVGTNVRTILDAFQDSGWQNRIDNPLPGGANSERLRNTLRRLRESLEAIDFYADGKATGILWQERPRRARASGRKSSRR